MIVLYHAYYMTTSYNGMCGSFYGDPTFRRILIMAKYDWKDLEDLRDDWFRLFGESMPMGFIITPDKFPMMKKCIETGSQKPLDDYIDSLPENTIF